MEIKDYCPDGEHVPFKDDGTICSICHCAPLCTICGRATADHSIYEEDECRAECAY